MGEALKNTNYINEIVENRARGHSELRSSRREAQLDQKRALFICQSDNSQRVARPLQDILTSLQKSSTYPQIKQNLEDLSFLISKSQKEINSPSVISEFLDIIIKYLKIQDLDVEFFICTTPFLTSGILEVLMHYLTTPRKPLIYGYLMVKKTRDIILEHGLIQAMSNLNAQTFTDPAICESMIDLSFIGSVIPLYYLKIASDEVHHEKKYVLPVLKILSVFTCADEKFFFPALQANALDYLRNLLLKQTNDRVVKEICFIISNLTMTVFFARNIGNKGLYSIILDKYFLQKIFYVICNYLTVSDDEMVYYMIQTEHFFAVMADFYEKDLRLITMYLSTILKILLVGDTQSDLNPYVEKMIESGISKCVETYIDNYDKDIKKLSLTITNLYFRRDGTL
ncbi:Importin alpha [Entamoeba marina]